MVPFFAWQKGCMQEFWKSIKGYEDKYEVSNLGRVRSIDRKISYTRFDGKVVVRSYKSKILRPAVNRHGYLMVVLGFKGLNTTVHRLVAKTFLKNNTDKKCINHIDGNKQNNFVNNLEWCSYTENMLHSMKNKLHPSGEKLHLSKLNENQVLEIRSLYKDKKMNQTEISEFYGVNQSTISLIVNNNTWKYIGG